MMKRILKKVLPISWCIKLHNLLLYVEASFFRMFCGKDTQCTAHSLRCESDKHSRNYRYDVLGGNIPICCASHLVELMFWIDKVLRCHGVSYHINYGTLLGAVRHQGGIIPWDTDVDISIDKNDMSHIYNILTSQAQESGTPYRIAIEYTELYGDVIKMFFSQTNTLHVDLFCYTINGNEVDYHDFKAAKDEIFPLREVSFYGRKVYAPNTLSPLNIYYGTDWNKHYYAQWGLFTNKRMLTEEKRTPAIIDYNLIHEY